MGRKISRRHVLFSMGAVSLGGLSWSLSDHEEAFASHPAIAAQTGLVPLIYSPSYNISAFGLEHLHPFDSSKYDKIYKSIKNAGLRSEDDFLRPTSISEEALLRVHTREYLDSLKDSWELAKILEVGPSMFVPSILLDWKVLKPMRVAAGGTLLTCRTALQHGLAINLGGGYHHAFSNKGGGFCVYSDVPVAINALHEEGLLKRALIIDTDAHQGNGFATLAQASNERISLLDFYDESIYPIPKVEEDWAIAFPKGTDGKTYLTALEDNVPRAIDKYKPDLIVYNAGSDVLEPDPLSTFKLNSNDMSARDFFVVDYARSKNIPVAMVLAGGYSKDSALAHAASIKGILKKFDDVS
ncbi:MAG: histone deacetylase [Candidatus Melainabacteria bacterium]|nr:histone deacetylase [Candidatus Melainabacteria bacterium]